MTTNDEQSLVEALPEGASALVADHLRPLCAPVLSTEPLDWQAAEGVVGELYRYVYSPKPSAYLHCPSPGAAFRELEGFEGRVGTVMTCCWEYQLPIFDPSSYKAEAVNLAVERSPNAYHCLAYGRPIAGASGCSLHRRALAELWRSCRAVPELDDAAWFDELTGTFVGATDHELFWLDEQMCREDPTCQLRVADLVCLAPYTWLLREAACLRVCQRELGCRVNTAYLELIEGFVGCCSFVLTFGDLCVLCDRPRRFEREGESGLVVEYHDGYRLEATTVDWRVVVEQREAAQREAARGDTP